MTEQAAGSIPANNSDLGARLARMPDVARMFWDALDQQDLHLFGKAPGAGSGGSIFQTLGMVNRWQAEASLMRGFLASADKASAMGLWQTDIQPVVYRMWDRWTVVMTAQQHEAVAAYVREACQGEFAERAMGLEDIKQSGATYTRAMACLIQMGLDGTSLPRTGGSTGWTVLDGFWAASRQDFPIDLMMGIMATTARFLDEMVAACEAAGVPDLLRHNLACIHKKLGYADANMDTSAWVLRVEHLLEDAKLGMGESSCMDWKKHHYIQNCFQIEDAFGLEPGSLASVAGPGGWLDHACIIYQTKENGVPGRAAISSIARDAVCGVHVNEESLFKAMGWAEGSEMPTDDALELEAFKHLGHDVPNLVAMMRSKRPMRALLVGDSRCGKTSLVRACAKSLGKRILVRDTDDVQEETKYAWNIISRLHLRARFSENNLILIDPADALLSGRVNDNPLLATFSDDGVRKEMRAHEIWTVSSLREVGHEALGGFDLVIRMGPMPLADRLALARSHFDEDSANRIARSCMHAGDICDLARWRQDTGSADWNGMAARLDGMIQARGDNKSDTGTLPVVIYPPRIDHPGFAEVVAAGRVVAQAQRVIGGLKDPDRYRRLGAAPPKGVLLTGLPGTGKTHLARAMAGEAGVHMLLADAAAMARAPETIGRVFAEARRQAPCLLFLDELDAIGSKAMGAFGASPDPQRQAILNRVLSEIDGFDGLDGVLVVGATHRAELLDPALTRAGRLGIHLNMEQPHRAQREELWRHYTRRMPMSPRIDWERLGRISAGMTPADIAQAANLAALKAGEGRGDAVDWSHLMFAVESVLWGEVAEDMPMLEAERWRTAVHEAGHALMAWHYHQDIERVCIQPRHQTLGFVKLLPEEGRYGQLPHELLENIALAFGGLAAEQTVFGNHGTGVSEDLRVARKIARVAVRKAGMLADFPAGVGMDTCGMDVASMDLLRQAEIAEGDLLSRMREHAVSWIGQRQAVLEDMARRLLEMGEMDGREANTWIEQRMVREEREERVSNCSDIALAARAISDGRQDQGGANE